MLTLEDLKKHVETDLHDDALKLLLDDAEAEIRARFGAAEHAEDLFTISVPQRRLWLKRPALQDGLVVEAGIRADALEEIASENFSLLKDGKLIERNGAYWDTRLVKVSYTPRSDAARRDRVAVDLVKLALRYQGVTSEGSGDYSVSNVDYQGEREKILSTLNAGRRMWA